MLLASPTVLSTEQASAMTEVGAGTQCCGCSVGAGLGLRFRACTALTPTWGASQDICFFK